MLSPGGAKHSSDSTKQSTEDSARLILRLDVQDLQATPPLIRQKPCTFSYNEKPGHKDSCTTFTADYDSLLEMIQKQNSCHLQEQESLHSVENGMGCDTHITSVLQFFPSLPGCAAHCFVFTNTLGVRNYGNQTPAQALRTGEFTELKKKLTTNK